MTHLVALTSVLTWGYGPLRGILDYHFSLFDGLVCSTFLFILLPILAFSIFLEASVGFQICDPPGACGTQVWSPGLPCEWYPSLVIQVGASPRGPATTSS